MELGNRIREARKAAGLTQEKLAKKCGLATITIRQYELGKREPRYDQLKAIADSLGVSLTCLIEGIEPIQEENIDEERKAVISSMVLDNYVKSLGYKFYSDYPDVDSETWLCVDSNEKKLYLLSHDDISACEHSIHGYAKFQIAELLKKGEEIPDTDGWLNDK